MSEHACTIRELVDGASRMPSDEMAATLSDSDSGQVLHAQRASASDSVEAAIARASVVHAGGSWTALEPKVRAAAVRRLQAELASRADALGRADSLDSGVPVATTTGLIGALTGLLELTASRIEEGFGHEEQSCSAGAADQWRLPWGPAAVFLPWNAPVATALAKISEALVAGNPVIIKASEWAPHFSGPFADAVRASLPEGVVQILHGGRSMGAAIVEDDRIAAVAYTGGVSGGRAVAEACARQLKPADLELSGNNPVVVLADADPQAVVAEVVGGMLMLNGQYCIGPRRLIVPESQVDDYLDVLATVLEEVTIGATTDPATLLGPLAHPSHQRQIESQLADFARLGCVVRTYGQLPALSGHFVAPTIVLADRGAELRDEVFGPVLQVRTYRDLDEAVTIANDHPYGLGGHVFSSDRDAARAVGRRLRAGLVKVNWVLNAPPGISPVGSMWGVSGLGSIGLGEGAAFFSGARFVG